MSNDRIVLKPKHPKGEDGYKTFAIRIKDETVQALNDIADKSGHSRNALIGLFLEYAINHCDVENEE